VEYEDGAPGGKGPRYALGLVRRVHHKSLWSLGGLTWWQLTKNIVMEVGHSDLFDSASALAFNFLLGLFPLMVFLLGLFGLFASRSSQLQSNLLEVFGDFLPPQAFLLFTKVTVELARNATTGKITFDIIAGLWFASSGMSAMISSLNYAYRIQEKRHWYVVRAIGLALTFGISILLFSALFIVGVGEHSLGWAAIHCHLSPLIVATWKHFQWPAALLFVMLSFSITYYFGPNLIERRWHWATPGSVFGVILWLAASTGFRVYLHFFNTYSASYGSLAAMMILLIWLYVTGLAFLIGGEINAEIERAMLHGRENGDLGRAGQTSAG
jgi:membrane protein